MKITFFSNFLHHHQTPFCDAMYSQLGDNFTFVSSEEMPQSFFQNGYQDCTDYIYNLKSYTDKNNYDKALQLGNDSDVVITGASSDNFTRRRIKQNKLTFRYAERFLKKSEAQLFNPRFLRMMLLKHTRYRSKKLYMLCASAYMPNDLRLIFAYPNKMFKWGYFTKVENIDIKQTILKKPDKKVELLWVGRFISWKHPELAIQLCHELKKEGYNFHLNMIGTGEILGHIKQLIVKMNLQDCIDIVPGIPNHEVHNYMKQANIFLFTSDRGEGWGAVLNEAMSNGCAVVVSHVIGAAPFLVNHQKNGLIFKSGSLESLLFQTKKLLNNITLRNELGVNAFNTLKNDWSPEKAASNFLELAESILKGEECIIKSGPGSRV